MTATVTAVTTQLLPMFLNNRECPRGDGSRALGRGDRAGRRWRVTHVLCLVRDGTEARPPQNLWPGGNDIPWQYRLMACAHPGVQLLQ